MAAASQDMVPAHRRAEAASYFSLAVWGGNALGPIVGDWTEGRFGIDAVWWVCLVGCLVASVFAVAAPAVVVEKTAAFWLPPGWQAEVLFDGSLLVQPM